MKIFPDWMWHPVGPQVDLVSIVEVLRVVDLTGVSPSPSTAIRNHLPPALPRPLDPLQNYLFSILCLRHNLMFLLATRMVCYLHLFQERYPYLT